MYLLPCVRCVRHWCIILCRVCVALIYYLVPGVCGIDVLSCARCVWWRPPYENRQSSGEDCRLRPTTVHSWRWAVFTCLSDLLIQFASSFCSLDFSDQRTFSKIEIHFCLSFCFEFVCMLSFLCCSNFDVSQEKCVYVCACGFVFVWRGGVGGCYSTWLCWSVYIKTRLVALLLFYQVELNYFWYLGHRWGWCELWSTASLIVLSVCLTSTQRNV